MKKEIASGGYTSERFRELQDKFRDLEPSIQNSEIKQALSVIYGMLQEVARGTVSQSPDNELKGLTLKEIASMYRNAPKMNGSALNRPLPEGTKAPGFSLSDADGRITSLSEFRGSPVLLVFYPLDWSPGCSQQLDLYQHEFSEFEKRGVKVLGISVDSIYSHGAWAAVRKIGFPLLSDFNPKGATARSYSVYREQDGYSERALYIIDGEGVIKYGYVSPYLHHIPDIYEIFGKLDEIFKNVIV